MGLSKYQIYFSAINDMVFINHDSKDALEAKFVEVNDVACQTLGYAKEELLAMSVNDVIEGEFADAKSLWYQVKEEGSVVFEKKLC